MPRYLSGPCVYGSQTWQRNTSLSHFVWLTGLLGWYLSLWVSTSTHVYSVCVFLTQCLQVVTRSVSILNKYAVRTSGGSWGNVDANKLFSDWFFYLKTICEIGYVFFNKKLHYQTWILGHLTTAFQLLLKEIKDMKRQSWKVCRWECFRRQLLCCISSWNREERL